MASTTETINCDGFAFYNNFDSANLARVEQVRIPEIPSKDCYETRGKSTSSTNSEDISDYEFNLWTKHDCHGTQYQNNNRTWFYFGVRSCRPCVSVKFNIVNLNKQVKMFSQGMCPVFKIVPGHLHWERLREKPIYALDQKGNDFTLSFVYNTPENTKAITYFAFTYPFSYIDLQNYLRRIDVRMQKRNVTCLDDVYYHRECAIKSLEGRRLDVLTISSYHNISTEREDRLKDMFPEKCEERPRKFWDKKIIFISARVHPGETPSSFVLNGFLNFLLNREDQIANSLRRLYVFKLIPMLNPDGVARGHYRMDTRGVNLNRVYLNPSATDHPTIFAARNLIRYYHYSYQLPNESIDDLSNINLEIMDNNVSIMDSTVSIGNAVRDTTTRLLQQVTLMTLDEQDSCVPETHDKCLLTLHNLDDTNIGGNQESSKQDDKNDNIPKDNTNDALSCTLVGIGETSKTSDNSKLYLYIDLHGHASKKGVFMYGNHFTDPEDTITCMLLPKLMSINNPNFHFTSCNFAERNMYIIDKRDGMSREGSGRVAVYKMTGLVRSYTLECNYNSGRFVNIMPARVRDGANKMNHIFVPPKYTPAIYEAVGAALGSSILDLTSNNPNSRLPNSQYRSLKGIKSYLKLTYVNNLSTPFSKSTHKDNQDTGAKDICVLKELETKLTDSVMGAKNVIKSENNLVKKCILRRGTTFYTAVKRIKGNKKPRQAFTHRSVKTQCSNDTDNSTIFCTSVRSEIAMKPFLRTSQQSKACVTDILESCLNTHNVRTTKKLKAPNNFTKTNLSSEETTIVRYGAKRLKIVSTRASKALPEIGESSCGISVEQTNTKAPTKISSKVQVCDKKSATGMRSRDKKHCVVLEQIKSSRSLRLKEKNKSITKKNSVLGEGKQKLT